MLLEGRIVSEQNVQGYWDSRDKYVLMMEQVYNEPTDHSVRALMDKFWSSWQDLSLNPTEIASRRSVLEKGSALVDGIHARYQRPEIDPRHGGRRRAGHREAGERDHGGRSPISTSRS